MNEEVKTAATGYLAPKIMKGFRLRWLVFGAAAYFGIRYLNKKGIFEKQTGAALDLVDRGIDAVKSGFGLNEGTLAKADRAVKDVDQSVGLTH